jgi:uncharacterized protein YhaN
MKLTRLDIKAFGPFTGKTLLFNSQKPGLHIIFGPNEAGKSSALRALKALLYGFPQQTPDNFLHSYNQLLIGGSLKNSNGDEIYFQRRKRRIGSIIDAQGDPLDAKELLPFLHGVEPEIFESLYGIDHGALIRGGDDILAQKGAVGQALFAAGAGLTSLREVIDQLEKEASELFKSAGQLPEINKSIKKFKELKKKARVANLSIKEWQDHQTTLKRAEAERADLEKERDSRHKELRHLQRLEQAIPELASLQAWQDQLRALGKVMLLSPDFTERYQKTGQKIHDAGAQLQRSMVHLEQIRKKRKDISFNTELLNRADLVADLHQRLGEYNKGQRDKPKIDGIRIGLRREAALLLKQVRPDLALENVEILRPVLMKKRTIQALTTQYEVSNQQLKQAQKKNTAASQELEEAKHSLAAIPSVVNDSRGLHQAVKLAQKAGDIDASLKQEHNEIKQGKKDCLAELRRIGYHSENLTLFMQTPLPLSETVVRFEKEFSDIAEENRGQKKERRDCLKELKNATAEIKKIEYAGNIPSEEELILSREKRELGWELLRHQWLDGKDVAVESAVYDPQKPLPDAYEGYVNQADLISDRLRREAERVANRATLRAQVETSEEILVNNKKYQETLKQRAENLDITWSQIWEPVGIVPLSPKEMSGWLVETDKLRYKIGDILKKEYAATLDARQRHDLKQTLLKALEAIGETESPAGDTLGLTLVFAETILEKMADQSTYHEKVKEQKKKAQLTSDRTEADLKTSREALAEWQEQWEEALSCLGLAGKVSILEALDLVEILQNCFGKVKEADDIRKRIDGIDSDTAELVDDVEGLLKNVASKIENSPLDQVILQLRTMLNQTQKNKTLHDTLSEEFDALSSEVSTAEITVRSADEQMDELLQIAQCKKPEEVASVIARFTEYQRVQEKISDSRATLANIGAGLSIKELSRKTAEIDADELPRRFESLRKDIEERINPDINAVSQIIGEQTTKLAAMDGNAGAAEIAEKMEQELTRIRRLAKRYAQVKLASKILQQEIERYREEHQDPVLKIGSRYFADLTMNSLKGLKTDIDDKGDPVLVGIRPDDTCITVDGMSDGTRDQLYLALRLATLESRLDNSEPMPFIVDDILINFDDDHSRATLASLAELGEKNQVVLFTHHRQIMEEAKAMQSEREIHIYEL